MHESVLLVWMHWCLRLSGHSHSQTCPHHQTLGTYLLKQLCAMSNWLTRSMHGTKGVSPSNNASMVQLWNIQCQHTTQQVLLKRVLLQTHKGDTFSPARGAGSTSSVAHLTSWWFVQHSSLGAAFIWRWSGFCSLQGSSAPGHSAVCAKLPNQTASPQAFL